MLVTSTDPLKMWQSSTISPFIECALKPYILAECAGPQLSPVRRLVWTCLYVYWNHQVACCKQCSICWTAALVRMPLLKSEYCKNRTGHYNLFTFNRFFFVQNKRMQYVS